MARRARVARSAALDTPVPFSKALEEVYLARAPASSPRCARCSPTDPTSPAALAALALGGLAVGAALVWRKAWGWRGLRAVRRRFPARIDRYAHAGRARIRAAVLGDPEVAAAVAAHAGRDG